MKKELSQEELAQVVGGIDKIEVQIKTLEGENDEYVIPLHNNNPEKS